MVSKKPKGLGMGLEALLGPKVTEASAAQAQRPSSLRLAQLRPGRYQPRTRMDEGSLMELAQSIKSQGLMQPVLVRPLGAGSYEIIAGERRVRAAGLAGLDDVPVLVRDVPDETAAVMSLVENIQREDLNPLEEAQGLQRLIDEFRLTHDQAAQAVGRSRSAASNLMRLLNLAEPVQKLLMAGDLEMGHARALLALSASEQILCANEIVAKHLSVRETERLVARRAGGGAAVNGRSTQAADKSRDIVRIEEQLADRLTAAVQVRLKRRGAGGRGEIAISFGSFEELAGLLDKLGVVER
ncbi:MAG: ParB/RepB/Spo0J family partition protein [Ideonella sp.]|nr:MAG: ParB/RepB/Spo0J family partition protein [Burkholderiaceae bacterium]MBE7425040.1 ParB/RepB/Spo0J family partition protein [Ideonella sp.]